MRTASQLVLRTKPFARELRWLSWWHFGSTLAALAALLGLACLHVPWWARLTISVLAGLTMVRMFTIFHDHQHGTILRGSRPAGALLGAFGLLLLTPPSIWRRTHNHHHGQNGRLPAASVGSFRVMT